MGVEASVIIEFEGADADDVSGTILVELDDEYSNNLDSDGNLKSSFAPEEEPVFIIHHDDTIEIISVECTDGRVTNLYTATRSLVRVRTFADVFASVDTEVSLSYFGADDLDETWYGNQGDIHIDGMAVKASGGEFPCYCTATFSVPFNQRWRLIPPPLDLVDDETYTIYVVIYVREIT